uniref:Receptor-like serine/threonine-protein kinase n=2 Tax=Nicotiana sylvestris TaxID=4096 RepID=A0A1U7WDB0_NICSY|nr:PREDICTED: G-type lectin S-receptor-like serine/threonine-protein kinase RLK1 [Nicotiana sylvestris]
MGNHLLGFLLLFLTTSLVAFAQASNSSSNRNITFGSSIVASVNSLAWQSPSGDFAFGFRQIEGQKLYLLAIWFNKIPNKTLVWYANGDKLAPEGSKLELKTDGELILENPDGKVLWRPSLISVSYASLLDTGNFILASSDSSLVWQSFDHPCDTILPTQIVDTKKSLSSRTAENNFSRGHFELRLIPDGNLVLNTFALPTGNAYEAYFWSDTVDTKYPNVTGNRLIFNESGYLYIIMTSSRIVNITSGNIVPARDYYYRLILEYDGVLTQYAHPRAPRNGKWEGSWFRVWSKPDDICSAIQGQFGIGTCGFNSYCMLNSNGRPNCNCLPGFNLSDPSNEFRGCERDPIQRCNLDDTNPEDLYDMYPLDNIFWPNSANYEIMDSLNQDECQKFCLYDCNCVVAVEKKGTCYKKKMPVSNGRREEVDGKGFVKVLISSIPSGDFPYSPSQRGNGKKDKSAFSILGSVLLGTSAFFNFALLASLFALYVYRRRPRCVGSSSIPETNLRNFTFQELKVATNGFKLELGRGAFGTVYKGELPSSNSRTVVAVKKLDKLANDGENEFKTEASVIARTHHKNLVRLVGFCDEGPENKLLVYEFMSHSSLADFLFGQSRQEWNKRIRIAYGVARGILYLHEECSTQIIHCDIKPQNILLDDSFEARISDFGLAKLLMKDQTRTLTGIRGTRGYVAPEWFRNTAVTAKVDVYSYGIVLLETICCRRCMDIAMENEEEILLIEWVYDCIHSRMLHKLVQDDEEAVSDMKQLEKLVKVAIWCIQEDPNIRPSMRGVVHMLEGVVEIPMPPFPN